MMTYVSRGLRWAEVWFDEEPDQGADIVSYRQRRTCATGDDWVYFCSIVTDLSGSEEDLRARLTPGLRQELRRVLKDNVLCAKLDIVEPGVREDFHRFGEHATRALGLSNVPVEWLERLSSAGRLDVSQVVTATGEVLVMHAHYVLGEWTRLVCSYSLATTEADSGRRQLLGRANRYLHWTDMLRFKHAGARYYDLGGWHISGDTKLLSINAFKREFGGSVVWRYDYDRAQTLPGRVYLALRTLKWHTISRHVLKERRRRRPSIVPNAPATDGGARP